MTEEPIIPAEPSEAPQIEASTAPVQPEAAEQNESANQVETSDQPSGEKKPVKVWLPAMVAVFVAAAMLIGIAAGFFFRKEPNDYLFYVKGSAFYLTDGTTDTPLVLAEDILPEEATAEEPGVLLFVRLLFYYFIRTDEDFSLIAYPDGLENVISVSARNLENPEEPAIHIGTNIQEYAVAADGSGIAYLDMEANALYLHDLTSATWIADNVDTFLFSGDGASLVYSVTDGDLFAWDAENGSVLLLENAKLENAGPGFLIAEPENRSDCAYAYDETAQELVFLAEDVTHYCLYPSGKAYFIQHSGEERSLCYYDGTQILSLANSITAYNDVAYSHDNPVAVYRENTAEGSVETKIAVGSSVFSLTGEAASELIAADGGKTVYYLNVPSDSEETVADLYRCEIRNGKPGTPELMDTQVSTDAEPYLSASGQLIYAKNVSDNIGTLYVDGEKIADGVHLGTEYDVFASCDYVHYLVPGETDGLYDLYLKHPGKDPQCIASGVDSGIVVFRNNLVFLTPADADLTTANLNLYDVSTGAFRELDTGLDLPALPLSHLYRAFL